jgi:hypothetical protein
MRLLGGAPRGCFPVGALGGVFEAGGDLVRC